MMEIFSITMLSLLAGLWYLTSAPMYEIKDAIFHAENIANQKQKHAVSDSERASTKQAS